jgi:hypothetical protein
LSESVTRYGRYKFGSDTAMPVIREIYAGAGGWRDFRQHGMRLNLGTATELRAEGVTMVRVRWRLKTVEISLLRYLGGR